jgi:proteasome activator subunit 4
LTQVDRLKAESEDHEASWHGLHKEVGIFSKSEWDFIMSKCLQSIGVPVGGTGRGGKKFLSMAAGGNQDHQVSQQTLNMVKPADKLASLASLIVFSMFDDGPKSSSGSATPATANGLGQTYLGGSRALDSLNKFIQATESFFHPSNHGQWSMLLAKLVNYLSGEFVKRWTAEEKPECKTPHAWRLTPAIKYHFVLTLRTVVLLSLYAKDPITIITAATTLRNLTVLSSELVLPSVLERAYPALENVIETHRINSTLSALTLLSSVMLSRSLSPFGGKHLAPLFDLCIPGIDVNDPSKTVTTCMFLVQAVATIGPLEDLTRPELQVKGSRKRSHSILIDGDGSEEPATPTGDINMHHLPENASELQQILPRREEDQLLLESTASFPDWVTRFLRAVFNLLENLPDPGKGGHAGGKIEDRMVAAVAAACDGILQSLSPRLFDEALRLFQDHISTSARSNSAKAIGSITSAFSRADSTKTLAVVLPTCVRQIRSELENGAASSPSTSTSLPLLEDTSFQYYCYVLNGALGHTSEDILPYADQLLDLLSFMKERVRSERGYSHGRPNCLNFNVSDALQLGESLVPCSPTLATSTQERGSPSIQRSTTTLLSLVGRINTGGACSTWRMSRSIGMYLHQMKSTSSSGV